MNEMHPVQTPVETTDQVDTIADSNDVTMELPVIIQAARDEAPSAVSLPSFTYGSYKHMRVAAKQRRIDSKNGHDRSNF